MPAEGRRRLALDGNFGIDNWECMVCFVNSKPFSHIRKLHSRTEHFKGKWDRHPISVFHRAGLPFEQPRNRGASGILAGSNLGAGNLGKRNATAAEAQVLSHGFVGRLSPSNTEAIPEVD